MANGHMPVDRNRTFCQMCGIRKTEHCEKYRDRTGERETERERVEIRGSTLKGEKPGMKARKRHIYMFIINKHV